MWGVTTRPSVSIVSISSEPTPGLDPGGGGTDLERGYEDVRPWRPPFHASPAARKGPISSKRVSSQDPLLRKFGNFSLNSLNFCPNFSSQAPKFGNFQLTSPQIWKFSAHKPPNLEIFRSQAPLFQRQISVRKPHTSEIRSAHPYLKKSWVPPPPGPPGRGWLRPYLWRYQVCVGKWWVFLGTVYQYRDLHRSRTGSDILIFHVFKVWNVKESHLPLTCLRCFLNQDSVGVILVSANLLAG